MTLKFAVGDLTIHRIIEQETTFLPALELLPGLTPERLAENRAWMRQASALDADDVLILCFQSYIVKTPHHTILVDSCIGNDKPRPQRPKWNMKTDDTFLRGLAAAADSPRRRRGKMRGAAQRSGIAIAFQKFSPRGRRLRLIDVEFHRQFRIVRLQRRVHEVARHHRVVAGAAEGERNVPGRVTRRRQDARMVADLIVVAYDLGPVGFDHGQNAVAERRHRRPGILLAPVIEFRLCEHIARIRKRRHPAAIVQPRIPANVIDMQVGAHHEVDVAE